MRRFKLKSLYKTSIKNRNFLYFFVTVMIVIIIFSIYFVLLLYQTVQNNIDIHINNSQLQSNQMISIEFENLLLTFYNFINDPTFEQDIDLYYDISQNNDTESRLELIALENEFINRLVRFTFFNYSWTNSKIESVAFIFNDGNRHIVTSKQNTKNTEQQYDFVYDKIKTEDLDDFSYFPESPGYIYFIKHLQKNSSQKISFVVQLKEDSVDNAFDLLYPLESSGAALISNDQVLMVTSNNDEIEDHLNGMTNLSVTEGVEQININNEMYKISVNKIENLNMYSVMMVHNSNVLKMMSDSILTYITILVITIAMCVLLAYSLSNSSIKHLVDITKCIEKVGDGNFNLKLKDYDEKELSQLSKAFTTMQAKIDYLINEIYKKQLQFKEIQYNMLQAQINPHFMLNTLVSIGMKAKEINAETIYTMVTSLSKIFHSNVYFSTEKTTTISKEIDNLNCYLYIQNQRFDSKITFFIKNNVNEDFKVPKLCLQPLVENSILHGFQSKEENCIIELFINEDSDNYYICVKDNGCGFDPNTLNSKNNTSIGLENTKDRIRLLYGEEYTIKIESAIGKGTSITLFLPKA